MHINDIIAMIPEDPQEEALAAIHTVTTFPAENRARVRCILSQEFRFMIEVRGAAITLAAEGRAAVVCSPSNFLATLRRTIHEIDEALAEGSYKQTPPKPNVIYDLPAPPSNMDLPIWDEKAGRWFDAEY